MAISLAEHALPHETKLVNLQDKPADFCAAYLRACCDERARAKVPVLETDDGQTLVESIVICEYLQDVSDASARRGPQSAARSRKSAGSKATARLFAELFPSAISYIPVLKADAGSDEEREAVGTLRDGLRALDSFLTSHADPAGPFLAGEAFGLGEVATAPFALRLVRVLPELRPSVDPRQIMAEEQLDRLLRWFDAVCERPSCNDTIPPTSELVESYSKLLERMGGPPPKGG